MKLIQDSEDAASDRKLVKSQVEKRRRERMNRSLERLRTMLLEEPQPPGGPQRRVEKTEILEHTVLFLQKTAMGDEAGRPGGQKRSFRDGFSDCLQRAAHFLGPEGKGLWLGPALDASLAARLPRPDSEPAGVQGRAAAPPPGSLHHAKSVLRMLRQRSRHRPHGRPSASASASASSFPHPYQAHAKPGSPRMPPRPHRQLETRVERRAGKQSPTQSRPGGRTLWRPWP